MYKYVTNTAKQNFLLLIQFFVNGSSFWASLRSIEAKLVLNNSGGEFHWSTIKPNFEWFEIEKNTWIEWNLNGFSFTSHVWFIIWKVFTVKIWYFEYLNLLQLPNLILVCLKT